MEIGGDSKILKKKNKMVSPKFIFSNFEKGYPLQMLKDVKVNCHILWRMVVKN